MTLNDQRRPHENKKALSDRGFFLWHSVNDTELHLTQGKLANRLRVSCANLNALVNGKRAVTPAMAI